MTQRPERQPRRLDGGQPSSRRRLGRLTRSGPRLLLKSLGRMVFVALAAIEATLGTLLYLLHLVRGRRRRR
ncbi:MAG: hypothetical protein OXH38_13470 [Chloroflexi bacterium]|nr:hypothetical protein [Chloroflexota bacterium]